jgi:ABC-type oligopeptide transport system ATPase subunit
MTQPLLLVENLQKHYAQSRSIFLRTQAGVVRAVDGVNFQVPVGATLGLVGESGCGKSTTARLLLRLEDATEGRIQFDGKDVQGALGAELHDYRTNVQAVFQDPYSSLNPRMRVSSIIAEPRRGAGHANGRVEPAMGAALPARIQRRPTSAYRHRT